MAKVIIFVALSAPLVYVSRASLKTPRSHGFYRFFAWMFILALVLVNIEQWFRDLLSIHQLTLCKPPLRGPGSPRGRL